MNFDDFLSAAWNDHADRSREVADRLAASLDRVTAPEHVAPYARIVTHVFGEHLGEWERGVRLLGSLRGLPAFDGGAATESAVARGVGTLRYAEGDATAIAALTRDDAIAALAVASSAFVGQRAFGRAIPAFDDALERARGGLADGSPALRALAISGNNLAAALEEKFDRDGAETEAMVAAARSALTYWKRAGTWLEEERAEYRLAQSLLCAGRPVDAMAAARRCIDVCEGHEAPALERFFAHAAMAIAARDAGDGTAFASARERALAIMRRSRGRAALVRCRPHQAGGVMTAHPFTGIELPIIQAPMAGVQGSALAIAVSQRRRARLAAVRDARPSTRCARELAAIRARHARGPFNVNFFCHAPPRAGRRARGRVARRARAVLRASSASMPATIPAGAGRAPFNAEAADVLERVQAARS